MTPTKTVPGHAGQRLVSVSTTSVAARHGFEWWNSLISETVMSVSISSTYVDSFTATATSMQLNHTSVSAFSFSPLSAQRTPAHIRRSDPERLFLFVVHGSPVGLEQHRNSTLLHAGEIALFSSSTPMTAEFPDHGRQARVTLLQLPRADLPLSHGKLDRLAATSLASRTASGALLTAFLAGLRVNAEQCTDTELQRLGAIGLDLAATFLAAHLGEAEALPAETRRQVLLTRIDSFIDDNLPDPDLGPTTVAAHHHVSVRTLHLLFKLEKAQSVTATIRRRRLERCRADLADIRLRHLTIGETALRWGFRQPADFSRAFRTAYGMTPKDFRHDSFATTMP